jgi:hypothetical protein
MPLRPGRRWRIGGRATGHPRMADQATDRQQLRQNGMQKPKRTAVHVVHCQFSPGSRGVTDPLVAWHSMSGACDVQESDLFLDITS